MPRKNKNADTDENIGKALIVRMTPNTFKKICGKEIEIGMYTPWDIMTKYPGFMVGDAKMEIVNEVKKGCNYEVVCENGTQYKSFPKVKKEKTKKVNDEAIS